MTRMTSSTLIKYAMAVCLIVLGCQQQPITAKPSVPSQPITSRDSVSQDYADLQNVLTQRLTGSAEENIKIIDLLIQLLEEIDLPTLCDVIANDTSVMKSANQINRFKDDGSVKEKQWMRSTHRGTKDHMSSFQSSKKNYSSSKKIENTNFALNKTKNKGVNSKKQFQILLEKNNENYITEMKSNRIDESFVPSSSNLRRYPAGMRRVSFPYKGKGHAMRRRIIIPSRFHRRINSDGSVHLSRGRRPFSRVRLENLKRIPIPLSKVKGFGAHPSLVNNVVGGAGRKDINNDVNGIADFGHGDGHLYRLVNNFERPRTQLYSGSQILSDVKYDKVINKNGKKSEEKSTEQSENDHVIEEGRGQETEGDNTIENDADIVWGGARPNFLSRFSKPNGKFVKRIIYRRRKGGKRGRLVPIGYNVISRPPRYNGGANVNDQDSLDSDGGTFNALDGRQENFEENFGGRDYVRLFPKNEDGSPVWTNKLVTPEMNVNYENDENYQHDSKENYDDFEKNDSPPENAITIGSRVSNIMTPTIPDNLISNQSNTRLTLSNTSESYTNPMISKVAKVRNDGVVFITPKDKLLSSYFKNGEIGEKANEKILSAVKKFTDEDFYNMVERGTLKNDKNPYKFSKNSVKKNSYGLHSEEILNETPTSSSEEYSAESERKLYPSEEVEGGSSEKSELAVNVIDSFKDNFTIDHQPADQHIRNESTGVEINKNETTHLKYNGKINENISSENHRTENGTIHTPLNTTIFVVDATDDELINNKDADKEKIKVTKSSPNPDADKDTIQIISLKRHRNRSNDDGNLVAESRVLSMTRASSGVTSTMASSLKSSITTPSNRIVDGGIKIRKTQSPITKKSNLNDTEENHEKEDRGDETDIKVEIDENLKLSNSLLNPVDQEYTRRTPTASTTISHSSQDIGIEKDDQTEFDINSNQIKMDDVTMATSSASDFESSTLSGYSSNSSSTLKTKFSELENLISLSERNKTISVSNKTETHVLENVQREDYVTTKLSDQVDDVRTEENTSHVIPKTTQRSKVKSGDKHLMTSYKSRIQNLEDKMNMNVTSNQQTNETKTSGKPLPATKNYYTNTYDNNATDVLNKGRTEIEKDDDDKVNISWTILSINRTQNKGENGITNNMKDMSRIKEQEDGKYITMATRHRDENQEETRHSPTTSVLKDFKSSKEMTTTVAATSSSKPTTLKISTNDTHTAKSTNNYSANNTLFETVTHQSDTGITTPRQNMTSDPTNSIIDDFVTTIASLFTFTDKIESDISNNSNTYTADQSKTDGTDIVVMHTINQNISISKSDIKSQDETVTVLSKSIRYPKQDGGYESLVKEESNTEDINEILRNKNEGESGIELEANKSDNNVGGIEHLNIKQLSNGDNIGINKDVNSSSQTMNNSYTESKDTEHVSLSEIKSVPVANKTTEFMNNKDTSNNSDINHIQIMKIQKYRIGDSSTTTDKPNHSEKPNVTYKESSAQKNFKNYQRATRRTQTSLNAKKQEHVNDVYPRVNGVTNVKPVGELNENILSWNDVQKIDKGNVKQAAIDQLSRLHGVKHLNKPKISVYSDFGSNKHDSIIRNRNDFLEINKNANYAYKPKPATYNRFGSSQFDTSAPHQKNYPERYDRIKLPSQNSMDQWKAYNIAVNEDKTYNRQHNAVKFGLNDAKHWSGFNPSWSNNQNQGLPFYDNPPVAYHSFGGLSGFASGTLNNHGYLHRRKQTDNRYFNTMSKKHERDWGDRFGQGFYGGRVHVNNHHTNGDTIRGRNVHQYSNPGADFNSPMPSNMGLSNRENFSPDNVNSPQVVISPYNHDDRISKEDVGKTIQGNIEEDSSEFDGTYQNIHKENHYKNLDQSKTDLQGTNAVTNSPKSSLNDVINDDVSGGINDVVIGDVADDKTMDDESDRDEENNMSNRPASRNQGPWTVHGMSGPLGIPAPRDYKCPGMFGYHSDPQDCQSFFICSWGVPYRLRCPPGTRYNRAQSVCDWAVNVSCWTDGRNFP